MTQATLFLPGLSSIAGKPLTATFDAGWLSSDGGVIVLREIATRLRVADVVTAALPDDSDPLRVSHSYADMALARMMMIAASLPGLRRCRYLALRSRLQDRVRSQPGN